MKTSQMGSKTLERKLEIGTAVVVVLLTHFLLLNGGASFGGDWNNHLWLIDYYAEFLRRHGDFPVALHTSEVSGMAGPLFYGFWLYRLLGAMSFFWSAAVSVRIVIFLLSLFQFRAVFQLFKKLGQNSSFALVIATLVSLAIYPLTNLYSRNALPEFIATQLLFCGFYPFFMIFASKTHLERKKHSWMFAFLFSIALGSHPITAFYGALFYGVMFFALAVEKTRREVGDICKSLLLPALASVLFLSPWFYVLFCFSHRIAIWGQGMRPYLESLDSPLVRFFPIPFDVRLIHGTTHDVSTPHLDAQINFPILGLVLGSTSLLFRERMRIAEKGKFALGIGWGCFCFFTVLSLFPAAYQVLPSVFSNVQFLYRIITYQNLSLLLLLTLLVRHVGSPKSMIWSCLIAASLTLGGVNALIRGMHALSSLEIGSPSLSLIHLPSSFYGAFDYRIKDLYPVMHSRESEPLLSIEARTGGDFGIPQPLQVRAEKESWRMTTAQSFPWGHFSLDGAELRIADLRTSDDPRSAVLIKIPPGDHQLSYDFRPDGFWIWLNRMAWIMGLVGCGVVAKTLLPQKAKPLRSGDPNPRS